MGLFYFLIGLGVIFFGVSFFSIMINRRLNVKQTIGETIAVLIFSVFAISSIASGSMNLIRANGFIKNEAYKGFVLLSQGETTKAIETAGNISRISEDNLNALAIMVTAYVLDGETNKAVAEIENAKLSSKISLLNRENKKIIKEKEK